MIPQGPPARDTEEAAANISDYEALACPFRVLGCDGHCYPYIPSLVLLRRGLTPTLPAYRQAGDKLRVRGSPMT